MMPILASWSVTLLAIFFVLVALLMMLLILIQKPKGGGLSGAFGGSGGGENAFMGAKAGDALTIATAVLFALFLLSSMGMVWLIRAERSGLPASPTQTTSAAEQAAQSIERDSAPAPVSQDSASQEGASAEDAAATAPEAPSTQEAAPSEAP